MNKFILCIILALTCLGCYSHTIDIVGNRYCSEIFLQTEMTIILELNKDSTFNYKFAHNDTPIRGTWYLVKDSLLLNSDEFIYSDNMEPRRKATSYAKKSDLFLIKKKKIVGIEEEREVILFKCNP